MAVPDYQSLMLPLLKFASEKKDEISTGDAVEILAGRLRLSEDDLKEMLPSGIQTTFFNRVGWASTYLKKAGLLEATPRGHYRISERGEDLLKQRPKIVNVKFLKQYPEFIACQNLRGTRRGEKATLKLRRTPQLQHLRRHLKVRMRICVMSWPTNCSAD